MSRRVLFILLLAGAAVFSLLSYNSGYGYDALEYLVIGRSLLDGYRMYDFIPSKSWGLYYLAAVFLSTGASNSHLLVTAITTLIFAAVVFMTYRVVLRTHGAGAALAGSALVALCAVFMELNYLEPEGPVAVCGLAAYFFLVRADEKGWSGGYLLGGFLVGVGFAFKSVAGFYFPALLIFVLIREIWGSAKSSSRPVWRSLLTVAGLVAALLAPLACFGSTGRLDQHIEWTYRFPLFERPAESLWMSKLFTKLLWFDVLLVAALAISFRRGIRQRVYSRPGSLLALLMGLFSLIALFKQQASHYVFPGAVFLSIFAAAVLQESLPQRLFRPRRGIAFAILLSLAAGVSVWLYNPRAVHRLIGVRDYSEEAMLSRWIQERVPEGRSVLFFKKSTLLYWLSHRYPNIPFLKMDVQETYALKKAPDTLVRALGDPNLALVECDPGWMGIQDVSFSSNPENEKLIDAFLNELKERFVLSDATITPYLFWSRKEKEASRP